MLKIAIAVSVEQNNQKLVVDAKQPIRDQLPDNVTTNGIINEIQAHNCNIASEDAVTALGWHYALGTAISVLPLRKRFVCKRPKKYYRYDFEPLTVKNVPEKMLKDKQGQRLLKAWVESGFRVSQEFYNYVQDYNQKRIATIKEHNSKTNWSLIEEFQSKLLSVRDPEVFKVYAPSQKVQREYLAAEQCAKLLDKASMQLTDSQLYELEAEGPAYDISVQEIYLQCRSSKVDQGFTIEPDIVYCMSKSDYHRQFAEGTPYTIIKDCYPQQLHSSAALYEAYEHLQYLKQYGDEFLAPNWARCPICNELYRIESGCSDHVPGIEFVQAPNLFYGDAAEWDDTQFDILSDYTDSEDVEDEDFDF